jgi:hypothetical protein
MNGDNRWIYQMHIGMLPGFPRGLDRWRPETTNKKDYVGGNAQEQVLN